MLSTYEQCPAKYDYKYKEHLPDPPGPAASRGTEMHTLLEILDPSKLETENFPAWVEPIAGTLRMLMDGTEIREEKIYLDASWVPCAKDERALMCVLDLTKTKGRKATVVDYKSGKPRDDHKQQLQLYGMAKLIQQPKVNTVFTKNLYLDQPKEKRWMEHEVKRKDLHDLMSSWDSRVFIMQIDDIRAPRPGFYCQWCPYSRDKAGPCKVG